MRITRRHFLSAACTFAATPLLAQSAASPKRKVIITGGHPGDPEYGCGGTAARYSQLGHDVVLLYLNRGEKICPDAAPDSALPRVTEARRACEILKARPLFAGQCDAHAIVDQSHYTAFHQLIQSERPDVLFAQWPIDGHADHRAISALAYNSWIASGRTFAFYYYEVSDGEDTTMFTPTDFVDISAVEPRKRAACYAHASQSPDRYYALQSQVARFRGIESGYAQAEAFIRHHQSPNGLLPA